MSALVSVLKKFHYGVIPCSAVGCLLKRYVCRATNLPDSGLMDDRNARGAWEADYAQKGRLYAGASRPLPPFPAGSRVLELGCGNGKTLSAMLVTGWRVTAVDFSCRAVDLARKCVSSSLPADIAVADGRQLPFRDAVFDAVVAHHVLGHLNVPGRERAARELSRVMKPGGRLSFCDFSCRDFRYGRGRTTEPGTFLRGNGIATHYFTVQEVTGLLYGLSCGPIEEKTWTMRVRGEDHERSEIVALFSK
jgi:MPBQ/MSBQ methyltransferase